jgi:hypothetical protein
MIKITQREHDLLVKAREAVPMLVVDRGDMTIAKRLAGFGWLIPGGRSRTFMLTHDGHRALTDGTVGTAYPLRKSFGKRTPEAP